MSTQILSHRSNILLSTVIRILSLPLFYFVITQLLDFPSFQIQLIIAIAIYAIALSFWSKLWMLVLPTLLPVLDLTPWSGRILVTEFDLFVLSSIAITLLFNRFNFTFLKTTGRIKWVILLLIISYTISTCVLKKTKSNDY